MFPGLLLHLSLGWFDGQGIASRAVSERISSKMVRYRQHQVSWPVSIRPGPYSCSIYLLFSSRSLQDRRRRFCGLSLLGDVVFVRARCFRSVPGRAAFAFVLLVDLSCGGLGLEEGFGVHCSGGQCVSYHRVNICAVPTSRSQLLVSVETIASSFRTIAVRVELRYCDAFGGVALGGP